MDIEKHKAFAQDLAALMRKHGAYASDITFRLQDSERSAFEQARMTYNRGRHGAAGIVNLIITTQVGDFKEELP